MTLNRKEDLKTNYLLADSLGVKTKRPITRKFWKLLRFLPDFLRQYYVRSKFDLEYELPPEITLKQAETAEEIEQALKIVHDSYVELGYIDPHPDQMRFNKYLALPTTVILIAKWDEEIIGTMSIIADSALGLPSEAQWNFNDLREDGKLLAEISSLTIKPNFKMRRGRLLMPLCKLMYEYCSKILFIDSIVISTTIEVEPFYLDVLLFKRLSKRLGEANPIVKGNPSTCCYLTFYRLEEKYQKIYSKKPDGRNLYKFFVEYDLKNLVLPNPQESIHGYLKFKNIAMESLLQNYKRLSSNFEPREIEVINNLKYRDKNVVAFESTNHRVSQRLLVRKKSWAFLGIDEKPITAKLIDISVGGFQVQLLDPSRKILNENLLGRQIILVLNLPEGPIATRAEVLWIKNKFWLGCALDGYPSREWLAYLNSIITELELREPLVSPQVSITTKKVA